MPTPLATLPGNILFDGGFDWGSRTDGSATNPRRWNGSSGFTAGTNAAGGTITNLSQIVTSPTDASAYAGKFITNNTKYDGYGDRSEVQGSTGEVEGQTRWYRWSVQFPSNFLQLSTWQVNGQWHSERDGSPPIGIYLDGGVYYQLLFHVASTTSTDSSGNRLIQAIKVPWRIPIPRDDTWHEIVLRIVWSASDSIGEHWLWWDRTRQTFNGPDGNGTQVYRIRNTDPGLGHYYKQGLYRGHQPSFNEQIVYLDNFQMTDGAGGGTVTWGGSTGGGGGGTGTPTAPLPPTGGVITPGNNQISLSWTNPSNATSFNEVMIRRATTGYPMTVADGGLITQDTTAPYLTSWLDPTAVNGTTYYYSIFARLLSGGVYYNSAPLQLSGTPTSGTVPPPSTIPSPPDAVDNRLGETTPTGTWNAMQVNSIRGGPGTITSTKTVSEYRCLIRGAGTTATTQPLQVGLYQVTGATQTQWPLVAGSVSSVVNVANNATAAWVQFPVADFDVPAGTYMPALLSGGTQLTEYAYAASNSLYWSNDTYADGPANPWAAQSAGVNGRDATVGICLYAVIADPVSAPPPPPDPGGTDLLTPDTALTPDTVLYPGGLVATDPPSGPPPGGEPFAPGTLVAGEYR